MSSLLLSVHTDAYGKRMKMHAKACSWTGMLMSVYPYIRPNVMIMGISARWSRDSAARTSQPSPIVPFVCVCVCFVLLLCGRFTADGSPSHSGSQYPGCGVSAHRRAEDARLGL